MPHFVGTLRANELEGGFLELVTDSGDIYRLEGQVSEDFAAGQKVRVEGKIDSGGFGIQMTGPALQVKTISPA